MDPNALYYALSTIAQCAAALAALIGFLGLWRLDRLREQIARLQVAPKDDPPTPVSHNYKANRSI